MNDLIENPGELSEDRTFQSQVSYQKREIKKWKAIARMVATNSDVLPFSHSTTEPERRWAFFSQASGILHQSASRAVDEGSDTSVATVDIF
jgi:hypothetical protein